MVSVKMWNSAISIQHILNFRFYVFLHCTLRGTWDKENYSKWNYFVIKNDVPTVWILLPLTVFVSSEIQQLEGEHFVITFWLSETCKLSSAKEEECEVIITCSLHFQLYALIWLHSIQKELGQIIQDILHKIVCWGKFTSPHIM